MQEIRLVNFIGVFANLIWFGLAKILVGQYAAGIRRMGLHILVIFLHSALGWYNRDLLDILLLLYLIGIAIAGFRTLQQANRRIQQE